MAEENVEYLTGVYERWGQGDFSPDPTWLDDMTLVLGADFPDSGVYTGPEDIATYMRGFLEPWGFVTMKAEELIDGGDMVLVRVRQSGTGKSSGAAVELRYFHLWTFDGERPIRMESIMHEADAMTRVQES